MNKLAVVFLLITTTLFCNEIRLRTNVVVNQNAVYLRDITEGCPEYGDILLYPNPRFPLTITNDNLTELLIRNGLRGFLITGNESRIVRSRIINESTSSTPSSISNETANPEIPHIPLSDFIAAYFRRMIDSELITISVSINNSIPATDTSRIFPGDTLETERIEYGLKEIGELREIKLIRNGETHKLRLSVDLYGSVFVARKLIRRGLPVDTDDFIVRTIDITALTNPNTVVLTELYNHRHKTLRNINTGDILRWTNIEKLPIIATGDTVDTVFNMNGIRITQPATIENSVFEPGPVSVKLTNGRVISGTLIREEDRLYVKIE